MNQSFFYVIYIGVLTIFYMFILSDKNNLSICFYLENI